MKRLWAIFCGVMLLFTLAACGKKDKNPTPSGTANGDGRSIGLGSINTLAVDGNEKTTVKTTVAAVVLDKDGKITECKLDEAEFPVELKSGVLQVAVDLLTKGDTEDYTLTDSDLGAGNKSNASWDDQVEAFCDYVEGMTGAQVSAIAATDGKSEMIKGCDLIITDFIAAVHEATRNAKTKNIGAGDELELSVSVSKSGESTDAKPQFDIEMAAVTLGGDDRITACLTDTAQAKLTIENSLFSHAAGKIDTKRGKGDGYGMTAASSIKKEWYEQADAFDAYAVGKTAAELSKLTVGSDGKTDAISGCTMAISGMLKNAVKAAEQD